MKTQLATYISQDQKDLAIGISGDDDLLSDAQDLLTKGCNDDADLQAFSNVIALLDKRSKAVLKARTNFVDPFKKDIRAVEVEFNEHKGELDMFLGKLNELFIAYQMKLKYKLEREAAARQEQARQEEADRLARVKEEEAELALFDNEDIDEAVVAEAELAPDQAEAVPMPTPKLDVAIPKITTASGSTVKIKMEPIPIIRNKALVPEIYKDVNVRRLIVAYEGGACAIPGVEFILKPKPLVR